MLLGRVRGPRLCAVEQVRVVAAFPELHENILKAHLFQLSGTVDDVNIPHQDLRVHFTLHFAQTDVHFHLLLGFQTFFHFGFQAAQQERTQDGVQALDERVVAQASVGVEPLVEILPGKKIAIDYQKSYCEIKKGAPLSC